MTRRYFGEEVNSPWFPPSCQTDSAGQPNTETVWQDHWGANTCNTSNPTRVGVSFLFITTHTCSWYVCVMIISAGMTAARPASPRGTCCRSCLWTSASEAVRDQSWETALSAAAKQINQRVNELKSHLKVSNAMTLSNPEHLTDVLNIFQ